MKDQIIELISQNNQLVKDVAELKGRKSQQTVVIPAPKVEVRMQPATSPSPETKKRSLFGK